MSKLLHALTEDNPDLQTQIGCMTGIFQLFDRQQIVTGRRITTHSHNRLPTGHSHLNNGNLGGETSNGKYCSENANEKLRVANESSRASFSSSSSSSTFFSLDCNKPIKLETPSFERDNFPEISTKGLSKIQWNASPQLGQSSLDFRDVVKDSFYKEARVLSATSTTKEEPVNHFVKNRDLPRPFQLSESFDGSDKVGLNEKSRVPADFSESLRLLGKLREGSGCITDTKELPRSSYEARDGSSFSVPRDAPRFSYDGKEIPHSSFESRDSFKYNTNLKELPRLSLDGKEGLMKRSECGPKLNLISKDLQRDGGKSKVAQIPQQGGHKQHSNIVAKLMGLEVLPSSNIAIDSQRRLTKTYPGEDHNSVSRSSKRTTEYKQNGTSSSARSYIKESIAPRLRSPNLVMKPISSSSLPIKSAPWRQLDGRRAFQKPVVMNLGIPPSTSPNPSPDVYAKIEKRLKELEFKQLDDDLRALKHMLDTMEAKGLLETKNGEDQPSNFESERSYDKPNQTGLDQNTRLEYRRNRRNNHPFCGTVKATSHFESPIVIMKPAKHVDRSTIHASSVSPVNGFSGPRKFQSSDSVDRRNVSVNSQMVKEPNQKLSLREPVHRTTSSTGKKGNGVTIRSGLTSSRSQLPRDNNISSGRSSGYISPRLQHKRLELEKQARPPIPSSDLSKKPRKQSVRQSAESGSPGGQHRPKTLDLQQNNDEMSEVSNEMRRLSHQGDDISLRSYSNISSTSQIDIEVTSVERSAEINCILIQQEHWSPSRKVPNDLISTSKDKKQSCKMSQDGSLAEFTTVGREQPSPVSVLDASFYRDDLSSPEKNISDHFKDDKLQNSDGYPGEEEWNPVDPDHLCGGTQQDLSSKINRKKLENVDQLVQKLRRLNSNHDESTTDYIASLCENNNPSHRYISQILIASGLLLRDLDSGFTSIQPHPSGHPINPDLFIVLEQTKISNSLPVNNQHGVKTSVSKFDRDKLHRKFIFDAVNEILERKFALVGPLPEPWFQDNKLVGRTLNAQRLLKELCSEVEKLQERENSDCNFDGDNNLKNILFEDVMSLSRNWAESNGEVPGVVLDVERMIFKDLVDEIVNSEEMPIRRAKQSRRSRQLFAK